jgi:hypothetical protein
MIFRVIVVKSTQRLSPNEELLSHGTGCIPFLTDIKTTPNKLFCMCYRATCNVLPIAAVSNHLSSKT